MAREIVRAVHHPDMRHVGMPYAPALLVRGGQLLFLSGLTAAPVYHSHPHREEEFDLPPRMREQAVLLMENLKTTLAAAGCTLADVVSATRYLTDVAEQDDLNAVWASYLGAHRPTTPPHAHGGGLPPRHPRQLQDRDQRHRLLCEAQPKASRAQTRRAYKK